MATVEDILSRFDEKTAKLAASVRKFVLRELTDIMEIPDNSVNLIGYGYGTGYNDLICVIMLSKQGVKLGFNKGNELPDPKKLLTGAGKLHRYVVLKTDQDIKNPALKKLICEALKEYEKRKK